VDFGAPCAVFGAAALVFLLAVLGAAAFLAGADLTKLRLAFSAKCSDTSVSFVLGLGINTVDPALTRMPAGMALTSRRTATVTPSRFANWSAYSVTGTLTAVQEESGPV